MNKSDKRILSLLLVIVMMIGTIPLGGKVNSINFSAFAKEENVEKVKQEKVEDNKLESSGQCGESAYYVFDEYTGTLDIFGEGEIYDSEFSYYRSIKKVVINSGITSIGYKAFYSCTNLQSITIPDSVTSIGDFAFCYCSGLKTITIGSGIKQIGYMSFHNTAYYKTSSNWDNHVLYIGKYLYRADTLNIPSTYYIKDGTLSIANYAFVSRFNSKRYSSNLQKAVIPNSVKSIGDYAFKYCYNLQSATLGSGVSSIGSYAFEYCTSLESIKIPNNVTSIGGSAFYCCVNLESITIPNGVTSIGHRAFEDCESLQSITIPNTVTSIGDYAFRYCESLQSITIPGSVTSIGDSAFFGCVNLLEVSIPKSVTSIKCDAFAWCNKLTSVIIDDIESWCKITFENTRANPMVYAKMLRDANGNIDKVVIPSTIEKINDYAFVGCRFVKSFEIPDSVKTIGCNAFKGCTRIEEIKFGNGVTEIADAAFANCERLERVTFGSAIERIGAYAFLNCNLTGSLTIPGNVKTVGYQAFNKNASLKDVTIEYGVETIGENAFALCTNLETVTLPGSLKHFNYGAFYQSSAVKDVYYGADEKEWNALGCTEFFGFNEKLVTVHFGLKCLEAGHSASSIWKVAVPSTCVEQGIETNNCKRCNAVVETRKLPLADHTEGNWVQDLAPSYTKEGSKSLRCAICNAVIKTEKIEKLTNSSISLSIPEKLELNYKASLKLNADIQCDNSYSVKYSSSNEKVATVDNDGNIYGAKKGNATITCTVTDSKGNSVSDTCNVTVKYSFFQWIIKIVLFGWIWY